MKKLVACLCTSILLGCGAVASPTTTARLEIDDATCSGTIVAQSTILSAAHCFEEEIDDLSEANIPTTATSVLVDGYKMFIIAMVFDDADHVLVKVDFIFKNYAAIAPALPDVGDKVHYWGNPAGLNDVYREGYVTNYHNGDMLVDTNGFFGDSGAGIFNESGQVTTVMSYITPHRHQGLTFRLMGASPLEFTPLQYSLMGVR